MQRLTLLIHSLVSTVLMGAGIVTVMVVGWVSAQAIILCILIGIVLAIPIARLIAKKLYEG